MKYVKRVIHQQTLKYLENLDLIKPNFVVHGNNWESAFVLVINNKLFNQNNIIFIDRKITFLYNLFLKF